MYPINSTVKALFDAEQRQTLRITGTDRNGASISITEANVMNNGFTIDRQCCSTEHLEIGTAIAAEMTLKLDNRNGQFNSIVFEGAELYVEIGIADWSLTTPTIYYIPCGYFTPDEQPRNMSVITVHALDRMMKLDKNQPKRLGWGDANNNNISDANGNHIVFSAMLNFPCTVAELVNQICSYCGVTLATTLSSFPNYNRTLSALPNIQQPITYRMLIQWCAGLMGSNAYFDWAGQLRFAFYGSTSQYTTTAANRFYSDMQENNIVFTGVKYTNTSGGTNVAGSGGYVFDLTGNYLAAENTGSILLAIQNMISGFYYRPFKASVINAPYLWPIDRVTYTDINGNGHLSSLTNVTFGINGATAIQSKGETTQTASAAQSNGLTMAESYFINKAAEQTKQLDQSLNQEQIFNRLTNNGETQGLLLYNGKVYLNADYIRAGTISADLVKAGILQALNGGNYWNMQTGEFVLKSDNATNGIVYQNGTLSINADDITAGTISDANNTSSWNLITGVLSLVGSLLTKYTANGHTVGINISEGKLGFQVDGTTVGSLQPTRGSFMGGSGSTMEITSASGMNISIETETANNELENWAGLYLKSNGNAILCCNSLEVVDTTNGISIPQLYGYNGAITIGNARLTFRHGILVYYETT